MQGVQRPKMLDHVVEPQPLKFALICVKSRKNATALVYAVDRHGRSTAAV
jgi:hypothetical protein